MRSRTISLFLFTVSSFGLPFACRAAATEARAAVSVRPVCEAAGLSGGLCVLIGCDGQSPVDLAGTGRYLVHVLEADVAAVESLQTQLHAAGVYGLASVEQLAADGKLPYTENIVNAIVLGARDPGIVPLDEIARVLCPGGVLLVAGQQPRPAEIVAAGLETAQAPGNGAWRLACKPRPKLMDDWTHARHAADGNPVSGDALVGPPRRVRWVTGPQTEISDMVTAGGRSFFAGVLARDAFNGLRLWERAIDPSPARGGFGFMVRQGSVLPIATDRCLLVVNRSRLQALDALSGRLLREYPEAGTPTEIRLQGDTIVAVDTETVRVLDLATGGLRWKAAVPGVRCLAVGDGAMFFLQGSAGKVPARLACRSMADGAVRWEQTQLDWLGKVRNCVYHRGVLACEISTLADTKEGNAIHVLAASDGSPLWMRQYIPGASHKKQARTMFVGDLLWVLEGQAVRGT